MTANNSQVDEEVCKLKRERLSNGSLASFRQYNLHPSAADARAFSNFKNFSSFINIFFTHLFFFCLSCEEIFNAFLLNSFSG